MSEMWEIILNIFFIVVTEAVAKKKFKILRDQFRVELKKLPNGKSGDPGIPIEEYHSTWPFFKMLFFLKDQICRRKTNGNLSDVVMKQVSIVGDSEDLQSGELTSTSDHEGASTQMGTTISIQRVSQPPEKG